jgi:hypothetical protein
MIFPISITKPLPDQVVTTLSLAKYNGNLADLTSVYVEVEFSLFNSVVEVDNDSVTSGVATAKVQSVIETFTSSATLLKSDFDTINAADFSILEQQNFNLDPTTGDAVEFTATLDVDYGIFDPGTIAKSDAGNISSGVWGDYVGAGNFTIDVKSSYLTGATFDGSDGYFQGSTPNGEIYAKVIYNYEIVPEPATLCLLGIGGMLLRRRRKV